MNTTLTKTNKLKEQKALAMKKKEANIKSIITTVEANPKFIKLLTFSLNSMEALVSPPNYDIRINAKIIIRLEGVNSLRLICQVNLSNEDIVKQTGEIIWKLLGIRDIVDPELAKLFCEKNGHEMVIYILQSKNPDKASFPLIKILNGLVQIPQLVTILIEKGLVETIKQVNDTHSDDMTIIEMNFDTMKKISNQKSGRDILINKNLIENIIANLKKCASMKNAFAVSLGLGVLINLTRNNEGRQVLKEADGVGHLNEVLHYFENNDQILKMGAQVFSRIVQAEDMQKYIDIIRTSSAEIKNDPSIDKIKELHDALALVSNLMLVEDIGKLFIDKEVFGDLLKRFEEINALDWSDKPEEVIIAYEVLNKYFMIVFHRAFLLIDDIYDVSTERGQQMKGYLKTINESIMNSWKLIKKYLDKIPSADVDHYQSFVEYFRNYFVSYGELFLHNFNEILIKKTGGSSTEAESLPHVVHYIISNIIINGNKYFDKNAKANYTASRLLKLASDIINKNSPMAPTLASTIPTAIREKLNKSLEDSFDYIKEIANTSDSIETLTNNLSVVNYLIKDSNSQLKEHILSAIVPIIINFMNTKPYFRYPNFINLNILSSYLTPSFIDSYINHNDSLANPNHSLNYVDSIVNVIYADSNERKKDKEEPNQLTTTTAGNDDELENRIEKLGSELLKRFVNENEFNKRLKVFIGLAHDFKPANASNESVLALTKELFFLRCAMNVDDYYRIGAKGIFEAVKSLIKKEVSYIEGFKRDRANESNPKYNEITASSSKRIKSQLDLLIKLDTTAMKQYIDSNSNSNASGNKADMISSIQEIALFNSSEVIEKSTDTNNVSLVLSHIINILPQLTENEQLIKIPKGNQTLLEKITNSGLALFRKSSEDEKIINSLLSLSISLVKKRDELGVILIKGGCSSILQQILDNTTNEEIALKSGELLKLLLLSNESNLLQVANQDFLNKLFEIRAKFAKNERLTRLIDSITNEIIKLPGYEKYLEDITSGIYKDFHNTVQLDLSLGDSKERLLNNLEVLNAISASMKEIERMKGKDFREDMQKAIDATVISKDVSQLDESILINEMALLKKINDTIMTQAQGLNKDSLEIHAFVVNNVMRFIKDKANYQDIFLSSLRILSQEVRNKELYGKLIKDKLNKDFVAQLLETGENYLDNEEVTKEINNILSYLCLNNPELAEFIVSKGGFDNIIEELKAVVNSTDEQANQTKLNGLKMLDSILNKNNMDMFVKAKGIELIHSYVNNEINTNRNTSIDKGCYLTKETINLELNMTETNKELQSEAEAEGESEAEETINDKAYFIHCLKIIQKGISYGQQEFKERKAINNLTKLLEANYPNKRLFIEVTNIIIDDSMSSSDTNQSTLSSSNITLLNIALSYKAKYYLDESIDQRVKAIEAKIADITMANGTYKSDFCIQANENLNKEDNIPNLALLITYISLAIESNQFDLLYENTSQLIFKAYKMVLDYLQSQTDEKGVLAKRNEGILISLMKICRYLKLSNVIPKDNENDDNMNQLIKAGKPIFQPENYIFVNEYNKEMNKLLEIYGKTTSESNAKYTNAYSLNISNSFTKFNVFIDDYAKSLMSPKSQDNHLYPQIKEDNLGIVIDQTADYYQSDAHSIATNDNDKDNKTLKNILNIINQIQSQEEVVSNAQSSSTSSSSKAIALIARLKKLWAILNKAIGNINISTNENEDIQLLNDIIDRISATTAISNLNEPSLRDILVTMTKLANNEGIHSKLITFITEDLEKQSSNNDIITKDLQALSALSNNQSALQEIIRSPNLWAKLKDIYSTTTNPTTRSLLDDIFSNATQNKYDIETLIDNDPKFIALLYSKILNSNEVLGNESTKQIGLNELTTCGKILKDSDNYKAIIAKGILTKEQVPQFSALYDKWLDSSVIDFINQEQKAIMEEDRHQANKEKFNGFNSVIEEAFNDHLNKLKEKGVAIAIDTSGDTVTTGIDSKRKLSLISTILSNKASHSVTSALSSSNGNDAIADTIKEMIAFIRKLYNELNDSSLKPNQIQDKQKLLDSSVALLKKSSLSLDNHKGIISEGFMNLTERMLSNEVSSLPAFSFELLLQSKSIIKNCSYSESTIPLLITSVLFEKILNEVIALNGNPALLESKPEMKQMLMIDNMILSNVFSNSNANSQKSIIDKVGLSHMSSLINDTEGADLIEQMLDMITDYIKREKWEEVDDSKLKDITAVITKSLLLKNKPISIANKALNLINVSMQCLSNTNIMDYLLNAKIENIINEELSQYKSSFDYLVNALMCLNALVKCSTDNSICKAIINNGTLTKIRDEVINSNANIPNKDKDKLVSLLSSLFDITMKKDPELTNAIMETNIIDNAIEWIDTYTQKLIQSNQASQTSANEEDNNTQIQAYKAILLNSISLIHPITSIEAHNVYLSKTKFSSVLLSSLATDGIEIEFNQLAISSLSNYLFKSIGDIYRNLDFQKLYATLSSLQDHYNANKAIQTSINQIAFNITKNITDKEDIVKFFELIMNSPSIQNWNPENVLDSLSLVHEALLHHEFLLNTTQYNHYSAIINMLRVYKDNFDIQMKCYSILMLYANKKESNTLILTNAGMIDIIKGTFDNDNLNMDPAKKKAIGEVLYNMLLLFANDNSNVKTISTKLMDHIIHDLVTEDIEDKHMAPFKLLRYLLHHTWAVEPFIQFNGLEVLVNIVKQKESNADIVLDAFEMLTSITQGGDEYKRMIKQLNFIEVIDHIIASLGPKDKRVEIEGASLKMLLGLDLIELETVNKIEFKEIKVEYSVKPEVTNFLTSGKNVKIINQYGKIKPMQLVCSPDYMKIIAKEPKEIGNVPKPKYVIDTSQITRVAIGHETEYFKKSKKLFQAMPNPEICFSVIGQTTVEGTKSLNIICRTPDECRKWIEYIEIMITYLKNSHRIKSAVTIKKKLD